MSCPYHGNACGRDCSKLPQAIEDPPFGSMVATSPCPDTERPWILPGLTTVEVKALLFYVGQGLCETCAYDHPAGAESMLVKLAGACEDMGDLDAAEGYRKLAREIPEDWNRHFHDKRPRPTS